jgi:PPOX class probable F420-dependent enzyme
MMTRAFVTTIGALVRPQRPRQAAHNGEGETMTADDVRQFARDQHRAVLATTRRDGGLQMSPVVVATDDDGSLIVSTSETAAKTANLRRHPRAALCLFTDQFFGPWCQAEGPVTIESLPEVMEDLVRYYRLVSGEHPDWDDYRTAMVRERRVLLRLQIERVIPTTTG